MNPVISYFFTSKIGKFCWAMFVVTALLALLFWAHTDMKGFGPSDKFLIALEAIFGGFFDMASGLLKMAKDADSKLTHTMGGVAAGCLLQKALPDGTWETLAMLGSIGLFLLAVVS